MLETTGLNQKAVYWEYRGVDRFGHIQVSSPKEILVRWEEGISQRTLALSEGGNTTPIEIDATVYIDKQIPLQSIIRLGTLEDIPNPIDNLNLIVQRKEIPDIKGRAVRRVLFLVRYKDSLPPLI